MGDLASPWRASAGIMSTPVTVRYDSYEEEQSWMTPGSNSNSSSVYEDVLDRSGLS